MFAKLRMCFGALIVSASWITVPAWGATVTTLPDGPAGGTAIDLKVDDFERLGNCGGGGSVVNDGCSVVTKADPAAPHAFGRFDPPPSTYWIDSQDIDKLKWTVMAPVSFSSMTFALTDAHDQKDSHFVMSFLEDGTWTPIWEIATEQQNGNLFWLTVDFGKAITAAEFMFSTKSEPGYDGYGISQVTVAPAPVPVPAAAVLLASGLALMAGFRRRTRR
ncbi:hypothetical protein RAH32_14220 [Paracoccus sp. WLY502]|uniref:hypothetical protein n=1 Tax=Paracoccus yibinensis TaxID=3068891 RepID=UPI002796846D|nr:hypothetical protein [Paracoccus sp. WLY502]MDQ1901599.1 hypothetical protein [Paracoccus sp. WLY502]